MYSEQNEYKYNEYNKFVYSKTNCYLKKTHIIGTPVVFKRFILVLIEVLSCSQSRIFVMNLLNLIIHFALVEL